jgi:biopolymer transport protein ExbD
MSMSVGGDDDGDDKPMSEINTTPLVDIMLVMLIIFLITVPVVIQNVPVALPTVRFDPTTTKPENVSLSIKGGPNNSCEVYWNQTRVDSKELLDRAVAKLKLEIEKQGGINATGIELPEAHIRGDVNTPYMCIGGAIYNMQLAGFQKVGFISEPPPGGTTRI